MRAEALHTLNQTDQRLEYVSQEIDSWTQLGKISANSAGRNQLMRNIRKLKRLSNMARSRYEKPLGGKSVKKTEHFRDDLIETRPSVSSGAQRAVKVLQGGISTECHGTTIGVRFANSCEYSVNEACRIRKSEVKIVLAAIARETNMTVTCDGIKGIGFQCGNIYRALCWLSRPKPVNGDLLIENVSVFSPDEKVLNQMQRSKYKVFNVITERAKIALQYFMRKHGSGGKAFVAYAIWIGKHRNMFGGDGVRFDAKTMSYLPACVVPFEGETVRFMSRSVPSGGGEWK